MTAIAATVQAFFTERLQSQRQASPRTITAYRDTIRMLLAFTSSKTGKRCHRLEFTDLNAAAVSAFLNHLEHDRGNNIRTRNARLAAIHSLFSFAALRHPEHADDIRRVLAIPAKRGDHTVVTYLTDIEAQALVDAPDRATRTGRRDHAILCLTVQTGLRASELISLIRSDIHLWRSGPRRLPRQRSKASHHTVDRRHQRRSAHVDERNRWRPREPTVRHQPGRPAQPRRPRPTRRGPRRPRRLIVPFPGEQTRHTAHASPHRRHATAPCRR